MRNFTRKIRFGMQTLEGGAAGADRLIFLQHGMRGKKEDVMDSIAPALIEAGYHVVAIDAYMHGERLEEPFQSGADSACHLAAPRVITRSVEDILSVYRNAFANRYDAFDVVGVSMGGLIAYRLAAMSESVRDVVALISSPKFLEAADKMVPAHSRTHTTEETAALEAMAAMDPVHAKQSLQYERLLMLNAKDDDVIPYTHSESYARENPEEDITFRLHEGGHDVSDAMVEDLVRWLRNG